MAREVGTAVRASASPTLSQYINLSNYAYTSGLTPPDPKLLSKLHLEPLVSNGQDVEQLDSLTGFYGQAFVTTGKTHDVIIAFEGTNKDGPDPVFVAAQVADDTQIVLGDNSFSYATALGFTQQAVAVAASQGIGTNHVFLTGHSLGAAEAEYVASQTGLAGTTFGTPGIVAAAGSPASRLHNYVEQGDPVGNYASNDPDYLGGIVQSSSIQHYGRTTLVGPAAHSTNLKLAQLEYKYYDVIGAADTLYKNAELYHPLGTYAQDLHVRLYSEDNTIGSDADFFDPLTNLLSLTAASSPISLAAASLAVCYAEGTRIRTPRGDVAIENLTVGDDVLTASSASRPIRWLGRRRIDCRRHPRPDLVRPIRIAAHAFGPNRPSRDLRVSPAHAIAVEAMGEVLIPAVALVNGASITQDDVAFVTYWHLELESHDLLLAENLPAESYLDCGNRGFFRADGIVEMHTLPDADAVHARFCRPYHASGPLVAAVRAGLAARAAMVAGVRLHVTAEPRASRCALPRRRGWCNGRR